LDAGFFHQEGTMPRKIISRRRFLASTSGSAVGLGLTAAVARGAAGANERIRIGLIGCGERCMGHLASIAALQSKHNVQIAAVCDVWQPNLKRAVAKVADAFKQEPQAFTRFGDLLALKDIDAVSIVTPDFSHGPILVASLKANKDVYVEKPMTIQLSYASEALDLARQNERVVQCGTQYRSHPPILGVAKEVAGGGLGKISRVSSAASFNQPRWKRKHDDCKAADVDWDAYLLHLPKRPFDASLLREWHLHRETSNGLPGLWMTHYVDATALIMNAKYPSTVAAHGGNYVWKDGREHADTFTALLEYPEGFLFDWAMSLGTDADWRYCIYGTKGTIETTGNRTLSNPWRLAAPSQAKNAKPAERKIEPVPANDHFENWIECLRTRERPRADIQFGHQHAVASIMAAAALESGRRQKYDPQTRTIQPA
jgi:predicted dehydrogenase